MPDNLATQPVNRAPPCPTCRHGVLMYPVEQRRGRCMVCQWRANGRESRPVSCRTLPFRTEAQTYDEDIYDDD